MVLWDFGTPPRAVSPTGLSPSTAGLSSPLRLLPAGGCPSPCPTSPPSSPRGIWFGLSPFRSPLLRGYLLASRPAGTKMFPFPAFPPLTGRRDLFSPGRKPHSGIPGSKPACGSPGLIAACHALLRRPSRAIHRAALPCGAVDCGAPGEALWTTHPRVEVIQPQVPLRLPCYDFTPLGSPLLVSPPRRRGASQGAPLGGATGGVCKGQGRIHRALVTRGY